MTFFATWEEFAKAAERLYMNDPSRVRNILLLLNKSYYAPSKFLQGQTDKNRGTCLRAKHHLIFQGSNNTRFVLRL